MRFIIPLHLGIAPTTLYSEIYAWGFSLPLPSFSKNTFINVSIDIVNHLFASLGMDMSSAVNIFLRQCILRGGLPFAVEIPQYNQTTLDAMAEARRISRDPDIKGYTSMADLKAALESED